MNISTLLFRCLILVFLGMPNLAALAQETPLFVGTYTGTGSKGIYTFLFNTRTGKARLVSHTDSGSVANPSYLAFAPDKQHLYAVNETGGNEPGALSTFSVDPDGTLLFLDRTASGGDHPCYVSVSKDGKWVLAANYSGGNVAVLPVQPDGTLAQFKQLVQHTGTGPNTRRQEKAHVHAAVFDPANRYVFVPDLGTDRVNIYRFDPRATEPLQPAAPPFMASAPGSGPRHFVFHPNGRYAYLIAELSGTVTAYRYGNGQLVPLQTIATHSPGFAGNRGSADLHLSPDGRFLYASNRGDANTIAIFSVGTNGLLKWVGEVPSGGNTPRNFAIAPGGRFVLVANQESNSIAVMKRDPATGKLSATGTELSVPKPVCLLFR